MFLGCSLVATPDWLDRVASWFVLCGSVIQVAGAQGPSSLRLIQAGVWHEDAILVLGGEPGI